jgi:putative tricarboxylic transport membrane protein
VSRLFAADRTIGGLCTLFGIAVFFLGRTIPNPGLDPLGPGWMPMIVGIGLAVMGILIAVTGSSRGEKTGEPHESLGLVWMSFALTVAYVLGIETLGYALSTVIYTSLSMWALDCRDWRHLAGTSIGLAVLLTLLFRNFMRIALPYGLLF